MQNVSEADSWPHWTSEIELLVKIGNSFQSLKGSIIGMNDRDLNPLCYTVYIFR